MHNNHHHTYLFISPVCHLKKDGTFYTGNDHNAYYPCSEDTLQQSNLFMYENIDLQSNGGNDEADAVFE